MCLKEDITESSSLSTLEIATQFFSICIKYFLENTARLNITFDLIWELENAECGEAYIPSTFLSKDMLRNECALANQLVVSIKQTVAL